MEILKISSNDTISIRHQVLRQGKPIETCHFDGDNLESTIHFGFFVNKILIGVISCFKNNSIFDSENQYQFRGMAVLESFQNQGIGKKLVIYSENYLATKNTNLIWFNARFVAISFYQKLGYLIDGDGFEIGDIGEHFLMFKQLNEKNEF